MILNELIQVRRNHPRVFRLGHGRREGQQFEAPQERSGSRGKISVCLFVSFLSNKT